MASGARPGRGRSTDLFLTHTSRYFESRAKRHRGQRGWLKWVFALWITPQMLLAQRVRREMVRRLAERGVKADRIAYRQRWKVETVMSVVKRRCGEALTARLDETQRAQALLRGPVYNVQRLVRSETTA